MSPVRRPTRPYLCGSRTRATIVRCIQGRGERERKKKNFDSKGRDELCSSEMNCSANAGVTEGILRLTSPLSLSLLSRNIKVDVSFLCHLCHQFRDCNANFYIFFFFNLPSFFFSFVNARTTKMIETANL